MEKKLKRKNSQKNGIQNIYWNQTCLQKHKTDLFLCDYRVFIAGICAEKMF